MERWGPVDLCKKPLSKVHDVHFPIWHEGNNKIILHEGSFLDCPVQAIAYPTNSILSDSSPLSHKIRSYAEMEIQDDFKHCDPLQTGNVVSTRSGTLCCRRILHTVGPTYRAAFITAAEHALYSCYHNCLSTAMEEQCTSLAFTCLYSHAKGYPRKAATHIALRTVRRFLEQFPDAFESIVFCVDNREDIKLYETVLPFYFPRNVEEEKMSIISNVEKEDMGNEFGAPIIKERNIRIGSQFSNQTAVSSSTSSLTDLHEEKKHPQVQSFESMSNDTDELRMQYHQAAMGNSVKHSRSANHYADDEFRDIEALHFLVPVGCDHAGVPMILFVGNRLFFTDILDKNRVLYYIVRILEGFSQGPFNMLYIHSGVTSENQPTFGWTKRLFGLLASSKYEKLKTFYVLHPTRWLKMTFWWLKTTIDASFYAKMVYLTHSSEISEIGSEIPIPAICASYDSILYKTQCVDSFSGL